MNTINRLLFLLTGIFSCIFIHANAGSALVGAFYSGLELFQFSYVMMFVLFVLFVFVDCLILKGHIKQHFGWILAASIVSNLVTSLVGGVLLGMAAIMMAVALKYATTGTQIAYALLSLLIISVIDVIIQFFIFKALFSVTRVWRLLLMLFISGFVIITSIMIIRIVWHI